MAEIFSELSGNRVRTLTLVWPLYGCWTADIVLDKSAAVTAGAVTLTLGALTLQGYIMRAGDFTGTGSFRLVAGAGGWGNTLPPKFYQSPAGLKLKPILNDAAREAGESLSLQASAERTVGFWYARQQGPASRALKQLAPKWWVRPDGVTEVGERAEPTIVSEFDVLPEGTKLAVGRINIATDFPEDWVPGSKFSAPTLRLKQVSAVVHRLTPGTLRTQIWTTP